MRLVLAILLLTLSACSPMLRQQPLTPAVGFQGPRFECGAVVSFDGARLGLTTWQAQGEPWAVIVAAHGMNDYANAFHFAAEAWAAQGVTTYAYDQRGFGRSPGRGVWAGAELMSQDLRTVTALARARHPNAIIAVVGESMGGSVAAVALSALRCLVRRSFRRDDRPLDEDAESEDDVVGPEDAQALARVSRELGCNMQQCTEYLFSRTQLWENRAVLNSP